MKLLIQKATLINPDKTFGADIVIQDGIIRGIEKPGQVIPDGDTKVLQAEGLWVLPGGIDPHVHLALPTPAGPSADNFESGSRAAFAGGVTHLIDFVTPRRGQGLTRALTERKLEAAPCQAGIDFHMGISGWLPDMEKQMEDCVKTFGIKSFKAYLAYRKSIGIGYGHLEKIMRIAAGLNAIVLVHAEEGRQIERLQNNYLLNGFTTPLYHALSRPPETESRAVEKVIRLVKKTGCTLYFVHISTAAAADAIAQARQEGLPVFAETCPHYLLFGIEKYEGRFEETAPYVFSPPARPAPDSEKLWEHLSRGTFDTVATDHCPFDMQQKKAGENDFSRIPNGAGGLEFRIPLLYQYGVKQNRITAQQWVKLVSTNAARIFGLPQAGCVAARQAADLFIFDPSIQKTLSRRHQAQNCDINIYEGFDIKGNIACTIRAGQVVFSAKN